MGMDVYGNKPTSEVGEYFRRSVWGWHPLAEVSEAICQHASRMDLFNQCSYWHSNDGDGLDADGAAALAALIRAAIESGFAKAYIDARDRQLNAIPLLDCDLCNGSGIRTDAIGVKMEQPLKVIPEDAVHPLSVDGAHPRAGETGWCNGCDGLGKRRPMSTWYILDMEDLTEWADFLEASGGFKIQ
jgi:hypothetical protein